MALQLSTSGSNWGNATGGTNSFDIGTSSGSYNAIAMASGSGSRDIPHNDGRGTTQWVYYTPRITCYRKTNNTIVVTKVEATNLYFSYQDCGIPAGTRLWGFTGTFYVRNASGGWHWDEIYQWTSSYYTNSLASYTQGLNPSTRTVWTGTYEIPCGSSWTMDIGQNVSSGGEISGHKNATVTITNTYTKPNPTPPTFSTNCRANVANGNTIIFDGGGSWGYCENQNNTSSYKIYDSSAMTTPIRSGSGYAPTISGLSPNTRYWASFSKSNGCLSASATCNAVTVTPNALSDATSPKWDVASVRLSVTNGGGVYKPTTDIYIRKCNSGSWSKVATSTTTSVATIDLDNLDPETCYQLQARTTTTAGTYTGNTVSFTTPKKGLLIANYTSITPTLNERTYQVCADVCYKWETLKTPGSLRIYYRVKDGYDKRWYYVDEPEITEKEGKACVEICDLYPNQTTYETYIHTETEDGEYDSDMWEFITPVIPEPDIHNCENFQYLFDLLCQAVKALYDGNKEIYANDCSKELCDPYSDNPTMLTLWSRLLRFDHAAYCLACDMGNARFTASKDGQYLVGEAGWQDILTVIDENDDENSWKLATSDAIKKYILEKLHQVWHFHSSVDYLVSTKSDLDTLPSTAKSAIVANENKVYRKSTAGKWEASTATDDKIDDMGVWHINNESKFDVGYVQAGSAWYYWNGDWQPMDADVISFATIVDKMWEKKDQASTNETGKDRLHITTVDRNQFNCADLPSGERWVSMITEPLVVPAPGYYEVAFETGSQATIIETQQVLSGALAQQPVDPVRTGYVFEGWNDKATGAAYDWSMPVTKNITIEAQWSPLPITITFDIGQATGVAPAQINTIYGATVDPLPDDTDFSLAGGTFMGWKRYGVPVDTTTQFVEDTTLVAYWTMEEFDVTIHPENGEPDIIKHLHYGDGVLTPDTPNKTESVFIGWFTSPTVGTGSEFEFGVPLYSPADVYAQYVPSHYTITFDSAGGSDVASQIVAYQSYPTIPDPAPTKSGQVFGWWMRGGDRYYFNEPITANVDLVAKWLNLYIVKFIDSFGDTVAPDQQIVEGSAFGVSLPVAPDKTGYTFDGWYAPDGHKWDGDTDTVTADITLTALYKAN